jgi:hypothetical protein
VYLHQQTRRLTEVLPVRPVRGVKTRAVFARPVMGVGIGCVIGLSRMGGAAGEPLHG